MKMASIKWIARVAGLLVLLFMIISGKVIKLPGNILETEHEGYSSIALFSFIVLGYLFSWYREKEGGIIITFSAFIYGMYLLFQPSENTLKSLFIILLLLVIGIFFWYSGSKSSSK